ncbi:hypothetical protein JO972_10180 [Verrucomicrobiaceae bacterium 5K15]|uniref:Threonine transporter n=1 Tax=Oceaniferula flava TaxID=2800421 RepID=A0AAE2VCN8_9BACT|nr:ABC-three component system middle component 2 [Oceaniferula flavus]MBK1855326.1 threonine transporter [Oceaniferula flavus]MBM1136632.1 hypothetical protein [Oceaniferula flavus]
MNESALKTPFNSSLETGMRAMIILVTCYPRSLDLQRLVDFDYLVVHSGDVDGPESLHPPLPMRAGELLIRRSIIESGVMLMMSRGFIERVVKDDGIEYLASETAMPFVSSLINSYTKNLQDRAKWVILNFGDASRDSLQSITAKFFDKWTTEFHPLQGSLDN